MTSEREALDAFFEDVDADWSNDNIRPGTFAFRFRHAADRLRAALAATPAPRDDGWEELRREIERLPKFPGDVVTVHSVLAIVDRLAAARGEPEPVDVERTWPSRDEFRRMSPVEVNRFFASIGCSWRVVE